MERKRFCASGSGFAVVKLYTPNTEMLHEEDRKSVIIQKTVMKKDHMHT